MSSLDLRILVILQLFLILLEAGSIFVAERDVKFLLRVRNREFENDEAFRYESRYSVENSAFDKSKATTFLVHGFSEDGDVKYHSMMSKSILEAEDVNLFFVDWTIGSKTFNYQAARSRVTSVAQVVGKFINFLHDNKGLKYETLTLVGFSLGAHVAGIAGRKFVDGEVRKVIGLDPAGPLFDVKDPENRLSSDSGKYVECIHTGYFFGIRETICQTDFYINSGSKQPGCETFPGIDFLPCSHTRVVDIFIESLEDSKAFYGYRCDSLDEALKKNCKGSPGAFVNNPENEVNKISGIFHVDTNVKAPFGKGSESDDKLK